LFEFDHECQGHDGASLEIQLEAVIKHGLWCTWRPCFGDLRHALEDSNEVKVDVYMQVVNLEAVDWEGEAMGADNLIFPLLATVGT